MMALDTRHGETGKSGLPPVVARRDMTMALVIASLFASVGTFLLAAEYSLDEMWNRIHLGLYTAEVVLGVVGGAAAILLALG
ncbi:MAG: hypothetical protein IPH72_20260 [Sandaracinaceae bacterium]|nr:hypothetical protein [Sandaracinaceae bacterium]